MTADVLSALIKACAGDRLVDVRDRALLMIAFASGGRRRSEISALRVEQLVEEDPVPADPKNPDGDKLPCLSIQLGRTKTTQADSDAFVLLVGRPVTVLQSWLERAEISEAAVFRGIDRWGNLEKRALTPQAVNLIPKRRVAEAGLDQKPSRPTACAPAISPKPPIAAFRCPKPCSSRSIARCNRRPTTTMTRNGRSGGQRGFLPDQIGRRLRCSWSPGRSLPRLRHSASSLTSTVVRSSEFVSASAPSPITTKTHRSNHLHSPLGTRNWKRWWAFL